MEAGAKGVECIVAGKIRGARAKSMKFTDGYMIKSGEPKRTYVVTAVRHVALRREHRAQRLGGPLLGLQCLWLRMQRDLRTQPVVPRVQRRP